MVRKTIVFTVLLLAFFITTCTSAQHINKNSKDAVPLAEGVFATREAFINQQPGYTSDQLYRSPGTSHFTIRSWSNKDSLYVTINKFKQTIPRDSIWGFYEDGKLFLQRNGYFHKVTLLGSISLFNEIYPLVKAPFTPVTTDATKEIIHGIIDLHSGKIYLYDVKSMMDLLQGDEVLLNNYKALNKKMRKKMMYSYVERFNDRHPLFGSH